MATAIISAFTKTKVKPDLAMTGEVTIRGRVLPVGGIKEKLLAAGRRGIKTILIPDKNTSDLKEIPSSLLDGLTIHKVKTMEEVLELALIGGSSSLVKEISSLEPASIEREAAV
jgi:ATP-dependent Lon protease